MADTRKLERQLREVPFFQDLERPTLAAVARRLRPASVKQGHLLFREGEPSDTLYLVESGRLHVWTGDEQQVLASLGPGSVIGEIGLLLGLPRTATVRAISDSRLRKLDERSLRELVARHPSIGLAMSRELSRRLRTTSRQVTGRSAHQIVAVIGEGGADLADALRRTPRRDPLIVDVGDEHVAALIDHGARIGHHDPVLVELSRRASVRGRRVVDVAEQIVAFEEPPGWVTKAAGGRTIIDGRASTGGLDRAVRWIEGRSIGLALSSGGSRTVAHIGVVKALRDQGLPIDGVAGSSGGALAAAGVAAGVSVDQMIEYARDLGKLTRFRSMDYSFRRKSSLIKGRDIYRALERWGEGREFSDMSIPLFIVATDVATGEEVVISSGSVADALRASMAIPGVLEPWLVDGRHLIDGAVANPLPASVLRRAGLHVVVGSNVAGLEGTQIDDASVPAFGVLGMMGRVTALMEAQLLKRQQGLVDALVRPRVRASNAFDFSRIDEFVLAGETAARVQMPTFAKRVPALRRRRRKQ